MRLVDAAAFFDKTVCVDAYAPQTATFKGQLDLYDDSKRDGTTVVRRVLSVAAGTTLPARRAVTIHGDVFLIGGQHKDSFGGEVIREKYVMHRADGLASAKTADQTLRALPGVDLYAARLWVKDLKELEISSKLSSFLNLYIAPGESIANERFVLLSGRWHLARNSLLGASGLRIVEVDELPENALTSVTYNSTSGQAYDPEDDEVAPGATPTVALLQHRWQDDYVYQWMSSEKFQDGDLVVHVSKTQVATAVPGDTFTLSGIEYEVISVRDDGAGAWTAQARP